MEVNIIRKLKSISFNYPLNFDCEYKFPTKYYLNVKTGRSIIKSEKLNIIEAVTVGKNGIIEKQEEDN